MMPGGLCLFFFKCKKFSYKAENVRLFLKGYQISNTIAGYSDQILKKFLIL